MRQRRSLLFAAGLAALLLCQYADALICYTCTATGSGTDCEVHPDDVVGPTRDCNKKYCTLRRVEYVTTGLVYSFYRSCEDDPIYMDKIITDDTYKTYFYACSTDKCNGGSGVTDSGTAQGNGNAPVGVTKPPFNPNVLHENGALSVQAQLITVTVAVIASIVLGQVVSL